jgi:hypothetical protein
MHSGMLLMLRLSNANAAPVSYTTDRFAHPAYPTVPATPPDELLPPDDSAPPLEFSEWFCELSAVSPPQAKSKVQSAAQQSLSA